MTSATGRLTAIFLALGLVAAAASAGPPPDPAPLPADTISFVSGAWGRLTYQWVIRADGSGEFRSQDETDSNPRDPILFVRRFQGNPAAFQQVRAHLRLPETYVERRVPCGEVGTDGPGGQVHWTFEGRNWLMGLSFGCQTDEARQVFDAIRAADAIVRTQVDGRDGERHLSSELPDIHPARIVPRTEGKPQ